MQKQKSSKGLYLTLAILLTIQAVPFLGMILNLLFVMQIAGIVIGILALIYSKYDGRSKMGAIFGIVAFSMAIISGVLFHMELDYVSDSTAVFILMWQLLNWFVVVAATVITYINTFKKSLPLYDNNFQQTYQNNKPQSNQQQQQVFYDNLAGNVQGNMQQNNVEENHNVEQSLIDESQLKKEVSSPLHNFDFSEIPVEKNDETNVLQEETKKKSVDELPILTDEVE